MSTDTQPRNGAVGFGAATQIIAGREITAKLNDRGFVISTLVTLVLVVVAIVVPGILAGRAAEYRVTTVGSAATDIVATVADAAAATVPEGDTDPLEFTVTPTVVDSVAEAERAVLDGRADVAVIDTTMIDSTVVDTGPGSAAPVEVVAQRSVPGELSAAIDDVVATSRVTEALQSLGANAAQTTDLLAPVTAGQRFLDPDAADAVPALILGIAFAVVFFFTALTFGLTIAQSVTEEKANRVVELLVAVVPVRALLVGKVLGNLAMALGQIVLLLAVGLLAASVAGQGDLIPLITGSAGWFVAFFVFGFAMLACLWAASGALASRIEDLGATTLPIQLLIMLPFFAGVSLTEESPARVALSYVPFSAPLIMPQRLVAGDAAWWEGLAALGIIAVTGVLLVAVAERLYRGSLLRTRGKASLRQAWASAQG